MHIRRAPCPALGARELRQLHHQHAAALGEGVQRAGNGRHLLAAQVARIALGDDQLDVVHKDHVVAVGDGLRHDVACGHAARLDHVKPALGRVLRANREGTPVAVGQAAALDRVEVDLHALRHDAVADLAGGRFEAEKADLERLGHVIGHHQGKGRLAVARVAAQHHHVAAPDEAVVVKHVQPEAHIVRGCAARVAGGEILQKLQHRHHLHAAARGHLRLQLREQRTDVVERSRAVDLRRNGADAAQRRLLAHKLRIFAPARARGRDLHQVDELLLLRRAGGIAELRVDRDGVGVPALAEHLARRLEDQPVGCAGEIALVHLGEHLTDDALVDQHRAEHGALGFQTGARLRVYSAHVHPPS